MLTSAPTVAHNSRVKPATAACSRRASCAAVDVLAGAAPAVSHTAIATTIFKILVPAAGSDSGLRQRAAAPRRASAAKRDLLVPPSTRLPSQVAVCSEHDAIGLTSGVFAAAVVVAPPP